MRDVHIIHIDGRSYRLREIDGLLRPSNPTQCGYLVAQIEKMGVEVQVKEEAA